MSTTEQTDTMLQDLRERARAEFTDEEIDKFINIGRNISGKALLTLITMMLKSAAESNNALRKKINSVRAEIKKAMPREIMHMSVEFNGEAPQLVIKLAIMPANYVNAILIPGGYEKELLEKINMMIAVTFAYWKTFRENNPKLVAKLDKLLPNIDMTAIAVSQPHKSTMYMDPDFSHRIGVDTYYVNVRDGSRLDISQLEAAYAANGGKF